MRRKTMVINPRAIYVALVCTCLSAGAFAVARSASWSSHRLPESSTRAMTEPASALPVFQHNRLEAERITLRATGFEPAEITRPAGRFLLAINDRSGKENVTLQLVRGTGDLLNEVRMRERRRKHEWRQVVNLAAGRYELREAGNPERVCQITITSN